MRDEIRKNDNDIVYYRKNDDDDNVDHKEQEKKNIWYPMRLCKQAKGLRSLKNVKTWLNYTNLCTYLLFNSLRWPWHSICINFTSLIFPFCFCKVITPNKYVLSKVVKWQMSLCLSPPAWATNKSIFVQIGHFIHHFYELFMLISTSMFFHSSLSKHHNVLLSDLVFMIVY